MRRQGIEQKQTKYRQTSVRNPSTASVAILMYKSRCFLQLELLSLPPLPQTRTLEKRKHQSALCSNMDAHQAAQPPMLFKLRSGREKRPRIVAITHLFFSANEMRNPCHVFWLWEVELKTHRVTKKKKGDIKCLPSSAFLSHSTNFVICSRKTLFPLARWASLYHFRMASSLKTSA